MFEKEDGVVRMIDDDGNTVIQVAGFQRESYEHPDEDLQSYTTSGDTRSFKNGFWVTCPEEKRYKLVRISEVLSLLNRVDSVSEAKELLNELEEHEKDSQNGDDE